jgi:hypothetical protein
MASIPSPVRRTGHVPDLGFPQPKFDKSLFRFSNDRTVTAGEAKTVVRRVSMPTEASVSRNRGAFLADTYMDKGSTAWNKMKLHKDCVKCVWGTNGEVRKGCKLKVY